MSADLQQIEQELRSEIYTALVELAFAKTEDKPRLANRLSSASNKLRDLLDQDASV
jgi:hypothetical protein